MSDWNKLLWTFFIISICTLNSILIKSTESKKLLKVIYWLSVIVLWVVCMCWVLFDFWK